MHKFPKIKIFKIIYTHVIHNTGTEINLLLTQEVENVSLWYSPADKLISVPVMFTLCFAIGMNVTQKVVNIWSWSGQRYIYKL